MSMTSYELDMLRRQPLQELYDAIKRDCRCVKEIKLISGVDSRCCKVLVTRIDTGIWEWNDEVVPC